MKNYLLPVIEFDKCIMEYGKKNRIYDINGKEYIDLNSGQFCTILGHSNEEILEQICGKMRKISHTSSSILTSEVVECAEKMHDLSGEMRAYSIILSTGSETVEFCIRYAKFLSGKSGIMCFDRGYHGLTLGSQSITYSGIYANPQIDNIISCNVPNQYIDKEKLPILVDRFEEKIIKNKDTLAAVVMEPVVSVGGMIFPPDVWFKEVRRICTENNVFLIFDESQTGFGRLGCWFAYQKIGIIPDMVILSKGIGLGYPVGMALFREELISASVYGMKHYSSHQNDSFAASIINTAIDYINKNNILSGVEEKGKYFLEKLKELQNRCKFVCNARGIGLMLGLDFCIDGLNDYRNMYSKLHNKMLEKGIIIQGCDGGRTLRFLPDYLIEIDDIDKCLRILEQTLEEEW